MEPIGSG